MFLIFVNFLVYNLDKLRFVKKNENAISVKVLADEIVYGASCDGAKEWNVNGEDVTIGVQKQ